MELRSNKEFVAESASLSPEKVVQKLRAWEASKDSNIGFRDDFTTKIENGVVRLTTAPRVADQLNAQIKAHSPALSGIGEVREYMYPAEFYRPTQGAKQLSLALT